MDLDRQSGRDEQQEGLAGQLAKVQNGFADIVRKGLEWIARASKALEGETTLSELEGLLDEAEAARTTFAESSQIADRISACKAWQAKVGRLLEGVQGNVEQRSMQVEDVLGLLAERKSLGVMVPEVEQLEGMLSAARSTVDTLSNVFSPRPARMTLDSILTTQLERVDSANRLWEEGKAGTESTTEKVVEKLCMCGDLDDEGFMVICGEWGQPRRPLTKRRFPPFSSLRPFSLDQCEVWFHGDCVNLSEKKANRIKSYMCPLCCKKVWRSSSPILQLRWVLGLFLTPPYPRNPQFPLLEWEGVQV